MLSALNAKFLLFFALRPKFSCVQSGLGGHTTYAGTGGAQRTAVNENKAFIGPTYLPEGIESRSACADDRHVYRLCHVVPLVKLLNFNAQLCDVTHYSIYFYRLIMLCWAFIAAAPALDLLTLTEQSWYKQSLTF